MRLHNCMRRLLQELHDPKLTTALHHIPPGCHWQPKLSCYCTTPSLCMVMLRAWRTPLPAVTCMSLVVCGTTLMQYACK